MYTSPIERLANPKARSILSIKIAVAVVVVLISSFSGCGEPQQAPPAKKDTGIIGKVTQDIGEAESGAEQADLQAKGMLAAPGAYGFAVSEISKGQIKQAVELYRAETGEYPKDYDEFMNKIIKRHNIELPVLPGERQYQYDVKAHELIVVEKEQTEDE